jgi:hypothetical protein
LIAAPATLLILGLVVPTISVPTQAARLMGDCRNADRTDFSTVFVVRDLLNQPVAGIQVNAAGGSYFTNSSGIAIVGGGNFTDFSLSYAQQLLHETIGGYQLLVCSGNSYYRFVWLTVSDTTQAQLRLGDS